MTVELHHGDCLDVMADMADSSVDAIVTDPPYGLGFMGKAWDDLPPGLPWAQECLRVLKPGGHLLAFGGTRTWHRLAVAVEDAGFEVRDSIAWLYGSGFPKSRNVGKEVPAFDGWGTALKPAFEPIVVARKPLAAPGTVAANVLAWRTGALNIDGTRVEGGARPLIISKSENSTGILGNGLNGSSHGGSTTVGRWPTNVVLDDTAAAELDATGPHTKDGVASGRSRGFAVDGYVGGTGSSYNGEPQTYGGQGGPSRFFPVFRYQAKAPARERPSYVDDAGNKIVHSTVKPLDLMRWLVRLVTPPGGTVLDPFAGSGATVEACMLEGFGCVAIEREAEYLPLIRMRMGRSA